MKKLRLSESAKLDLIEIEQYSMENWGENAASKYMAILKNGFKALRSNSFLGMDRSSLKDGYRSLSFGQHIIFYKPRETEIYVLAVLHEKQSLVKNLEDREEN